MSSKTLAFIVLLAAVVVAAGGGSYLAVRHNAAVTQTQAAAADKSAGPAVPTAEPGEDEAAVADRAPVDAPMAPAEPAVSAAPRPDAGAAVAVGPAAPAQTSRPSKARSSAAKPEIRSAPEPAAAQAKPTPDAVPVAAETDPAPPPQAAIPAAESVPQAPPVPPAEAPLPPQREFVELVVPADSVVGFQLVTAINSERAHIEDRVDARISRDVRVDGRVAIPAGSEAMGVVTLVEPGGKIKNAARIGIRFHTVTLPDGTRASISTDPLVREGESPAKGSVAKIGGAAVGGAILGAILGGGKGAAIGGSIGAAGGTAAAMSGRRNEVILPAGSVVSARLLQPVTVVVEK